MNPLKVLKRPSAFLPVAMSLGALATVLLFIALHGAALQADGVEETRNSGPGNA